MNETLHKEIPSLDLADFTSGDPARKAKFVEDLGNAFNTIGFVAIRNHYLTNELSDKLYGSISAVLLLAGGAEEKYEYPELHGQRGYIGRNKETAKGFRTPDLKEFYHVGQKVTDNDPIRNEYPDNVWPAEFPEMKEAATEAYRRLERTGVEILRAIALYLGLEENYFDGKVKNGNSILRALHYFPIENPDTVPPDAVRAAAHGDINLITLLMGASAEGLQVLRRDGKWIDITALPEQLVVNVGDMLTGSPTTSSSPPFTGSSIRPAKNDFFPFLDALNFMHPRSEMDSTCLGPALTPGTEKLFRHDGG